MAQKGFNYEESRKVRESRELRESRESNKPLDDPKSKNKNLNGEVRPIPEQSQHPNFKTSNKQNYF